MVSRTDIGTSRVFEDDTPSSNRGVENIPTLEVGGLDRLKLTFFGTWDLVALDRLKSSIEMARSRAGEGKSAMLDLPNGDIAIVHPRSAQMGGITAPYRLQVGGMNVYLITHGTEGMPVLIVDVGSLRCMNSGLDIFGEVAEFAEKLGCRADKTFVSSVDVCVDVLDFDVAEMAECIRQRHVLCHQTKVKLEGDGEISGVTLGTHGSPVSLNVYAKAVELLQGRRGAPEAARKIAYLEDHRWGCSVHEAKRRGAARIEFRMRGKDFLKPREIRTPEAFKKELASICNYLVREWCRVVDRPPDRKNNHQARCKTHPLWEKVQEAFSRIAAGQMVRTLRVNRERVLCESQLLFKQAIGCVVRALSVQGIALDVDHVEAKAGLANAFCDAVQSIEDERKDTRDCLSNRSWFSFVEIESKLPGVPVPVT